MIDSKMISRLEKTIGNNSIANLQDISVFKDSDGTYQLYNKYTITTVNSMYEVTGPSIIDKISFFTLKNAVAWCSFDKRVRVSDCKRIFQLDHTLAGIETSIAQHRRLSKNSKKIDEELIYLAKLGEEQLKRKQMQDELTGYIQQSRYWQNQKFNTKA
jgi:hypothetical protein